MPSDRSLSHLCTYASLSLSLWLAGGALQSHAHLDNRADADQVVCNSLVTRTFCCCIHALARSKVCMLRARLEDCGLECRQ